MTKIVIIGCGIIGAAIAYELSQVTGFNITVIDEKVPASGSTGAALGILMGIISQKIKGKAWELRQESIKLYKTLIPELERLTGLSIPHNRQGILKLCFEGDDLQKWDELIQIRKSQGWTLERWETPHLTRKCPQLDNDKIIGAIYSPEDLQINPTYLTEALVKGAQINGVNCQFGVKVQNLILSDPDGSNLRHCYQIQTPLATLETDWLIIAAGLGSTPLSASLKQPVNIHPVLGQALTLKLDQPVGNKDFQPVITGDDIHIAPLGNGNYWIGATVEFPDEKGEVIPQTELLEQIKQQAISFCPALERGKIINTWFGKRPRPQGQPAPIISQLSGYSNILLGTGHYRNGVLLAPATAKKIRELIVV
ncbi:FAD dependent oxidoreductase [Gloeothece citriformis PCC 7424]|uniref:FAD dependent oxidoreductase n=1 Tax=Gloeothece citriformis (strain PCC 7424) TaxID=65393 RepID=B7KAJ6_GLOC7|nr:FAD-dependent oxidoreductase [Gloeothece citriformis]ACK68668.1 FAD dependent oxidoreductase [Gloeothece citriformis PCC 7424]